MSLKKKVVEDEIKTSSRFKRYLKFAIKLVITTAALYFVFQKVDFSKVLATMLDTKIHYFLLALLMFNVSKLVAALRIDKFFRAIDINLNRLYNFKLLYVGMFYNMFLPGSIGGDGYKVYLLKQRFDVKTRHIISAALLDRVSGVALLFMIACVFLFFSSFMPGIPYFKGIVVTAVVLSLPALYFFIRWFFPIFKKKFQSTTFFSFWVQVGQVIAAIFLLLALSVQDHYLEYLTLFMVSSVVAVIPFTIAGAGARELVFLYGFQYLDIEEDKAITFSILFFAVTALSSFIGLLFSYNMDKEGLKVTDD